MTSSFTANIARVLDELTPAERESAVAYLAVEPVEQGTRLSLPGVEILAEARSLLVFVDQDPTANWGHPARYILFACDDATHVISVPARLPPFGEKGGLHWQLAYRATAIPDSAVTL